MCDLKRTLDATVLPLPSFPAILSTMCLIGSLRTGDAFGDWENGVAVVSDCFLSTGQLILSSC